MFTSQGMGFLMIQTVVHVQAKNDTIKITTKEYRQRTKRSDSQIHEHPQNNADPSASLLP